MRRVALATMTSRCVFSARSTLTACSGGTSTHTATPVSAVTLNQKYLCATRSVSASVDKTSAMTHTPRTHPLDELKQKFGEESWKTFEEKMPEWAEQLKNYSADTIFHVLVAYGISPLRAPALATALVEYFNNAGDGTVHGVLQFLEGKGIVKNPRAPKYLANLGAVPPQEHGTVNGVPLDPRRAACDIFIDTFEKALQTLPIQGWYYECDPLPLVANVGFKGSGKTTLKLLCMERFVKTYPDSRAIYVTFTDGQRHEPGGGVASFDGSTEVGTRILHRVAQHLKEEDLNFHSFRKELRGSVPFGVAVEAARELLGMDPTAHLLVAVDELVRLNEGDDNAVTAAQTLNMLCEHMTASFRAANTWKGPAERRPGVTYLVASASRAVDALSITSHRPVFLQDLDPLYYTQRMADTLHDHFNKSTEPAKNVVLVPGSVGWPSTLPGTNTSDMRTVRAIIMNTLWCTGFHPLSLCCVLERFKHQPTGEQGPQLMEAMKEWSENALNHADELACVQEHSCAGALLNTRGTAVPSPPIVWLRTAPEDYEWQCRPAATSLRPNERAGQHPTGCKWFLWSPDAATSPGGDGS